MAGGVILCDPCLFVETETEAVGFCGICVEYMCAGCIHDHRKSKMLRNHKIQQENMPQNADIIKAMNEMKVCEIHKEMDITYKCDDHNECVCTVCRVDSHNKCEHVFELSRKHTTDRDVNNIQQDLAEVEETAAAIRKRREENKTDLSQTQTEILREQEAIIQKAIDSLEELKTKHRRETDEKTQAALSEIERDIGVAENIEKNSARNREILEAALKCDDQSCPKVIVHLMTDRVKALKSDVKKIQQKGQLKLTFEANQDCIAVSCLGTIAVNHCETDDTENDKARKTGIEKTSDELLGADFINAPVGGKTAEDASCVTSTPDNIIVIDGKLFNVRGATDMKSCSIFGSVVLPDGQIVIIDLTNTNIKLLSSDFSILNILRLPGRPIRICSVGGSMVAVSFERLKRINRYSVDGNMISYEGGFSTLLFNHGIAFDGNNIVAIMSDVDYSTNNCAEDDLIQLEIRHVHDGDVIDVIKDFRVVGGKSSSFVLNNTQTVCFAADGSVIIAEMNRVLRFCLSKTVAIEKDYYDCSREIAKKDIQDVTLDSHSIYVCTGSGSVLQISIADFKRRRIILSGIGKDIRSVTVDNINNRIILGCYDDDSIHVCSFKRNPYLKKQKKR